MRKQIIFMSVLMLNTLMIQNSLESYCNIPKECNAITQKINHKSSDIKILRCLLTSGSTLRFNSSKIGKECKHLNISDYIWIQLRPKTEGSIRLEKGMLDLKDLFEFLKIFKTDGLFFLEFQFFKGFDLNLFDEMDTNFNITNIIIDFMFFDNVLDFYWKEKKINTCQDIINATNSTNPRSIFQMISKIYTNEASIYLTEPKSRICPLAFKNYETLKLYINGENSFYSQKILSFSNETFQDLNTTIIELYLDINNIDLDCNILHLDVFKELYKLHIDGKINKIQPDLFIKLNRVKEIFVNNFYFRSLMHKSGIEWVKNYNKDVTCDFENVTWQSYYDTKYIVFDCFNSLVSPPLAKIFPEEDFCLYKDFPVNKLVLIIESCPETVTSNNWKDKEKVTCTYLWITRCYNDIIKTYSDSNYNKSISDCNFQLKLEMCNKSNFQPKSVSTFFELKLTMKMAESVFNILSYILSVFGFVTNLLIIKAISSKKNEKKFKEFKQYDYLRLNSVCNCFILFIHMISWFNHCVYPFQVFCPRFRKTIFMQYFNIVVERVLLNAFTLMNNFTYIGFAFNRISLIGKDHNKLVKFMSDLSVKKYIAFSSFISIGLSIIKLFEYEINSGISTANYPISYEYLSEQFNQITKQLKPTLYILNFLIDLINNLIFILFNLSIDVGMMVKLRKTLNEKFEKSKEYSTKAQIEKKKAENEKALHNARSMIIMNISLSILLKSPSLFYSLIHLFYFYNRSTFIENKFISFYKYICYDLSCDALIQLTTFLYLIFISIQLFFYKHYDKKLSEAFNGNDK